MRGQERIEEMWAYVIVDDDGTEGVIGHMTPEGWVPMVGADRERMDSLLPIAKRVAGMKGRAVEMVRFAQRTSVRWIKPGTTRQPPAVEHTGESLRVGFRQYEKPEMRDTKLSEVRGLIVRAASVGGKPAIVLDLDFGDGVLAEGIAFIGERADDLVTMGRQALDALRSGNN